MQRKTALNYIITIVTVLSLSFAASYTLYATAHQNGIIYERNAALSMDVGTHSLHVTVNLQRVGELEPTFWSHHPGVLTTIGKNWIEDQLGDSPSTDPAKWISVSTNVTEPSAAWTEIPQEIAADGLTRASGTYASTCLLYTSPSPRDRR